MCSHSVSVILVLMRVVEPKQLREHSKHVSKKHKKQRRKSVLSVFLLILLCLYIFVSLLVPQPLLQAETTTIKLEPKPPVSMPWPEYGQAAVGAVGYGLLDQHGQQSPVPIASVAKVITAIAVLKAKPLQTDEQGPVLTFTAEDERTYNNYLSEGQSVIPVEAGGQMTQYQALQALMLPSANNMAEILVGWAFGSMDNYIKYMESFTRSLGLTNTTIADASGYNPATTSTAADLTKLAEIAMNNPVLADIAAQPEADLPMAGTVYNVNNFLGQGGLVGIKTGNTDEAGGCFMFAARRDIGDDQEAVVVGVVIGAATRNLALEDSLLLIDETFKGFSTVQPLKTGQVVGSISQSGGNLSDIRVLQGLTVATWADKQPQIAADLRPLDKAINKGEEVGTMRVHIGTKSYAVALVAGDDLRPRSLFWRLLHAGGYL